MSRHRSLLFMVAVLATVSSLSAATAQTVSVSLNLEFNTPGDFSSGGTWTAVAKSQSQGIAAVNLYLSDTIFGSFLAPPELDVQMQTGTTVVRNVTTGDNAVPPYPLGIGVIGSSFPSTYVDPPGLVPFGGNPDLGSFTGGIALATGTFLPGTVADYTSQGPIPNISDSNVFTGPFPAPIVDADTLLTVRYVVPEPATLSLAGVGVLCALASARRRKR